MAKKWGLPPENPEIIPEKTGLAKVKQKVKEKPPVDDFADLIDKSRIAELEQEIFKAKSMKYKADQDFIKLKKESGDLIEYAMADYLFAGFMELTNFQILTFLRKIEPDIKNFCKENEPMELIKQMSLGLEGILQDVKKQQKEEVKKWKKDL